MTRNCRGRVFWTACRVVFFSPHQSWSPFPSPCASSPRSPSRREGRRSFYFILFSTSRKRGVVVAAVTAVIAPFNNSLSKQQNKFHFWVRLRQRFSVSFVRSFGLTTTEPAAAAACCLFLCIKLHLDQLKRKEKRIELTFKNGLTSSGKLPSPSSVVK